VGTSAIAREVEQVGNRLETCSTGELSSLQHLERIADFALVKTDVEAWNE
jgi:hypothetical protein